MSVFVAMCAVWALLLVGAVAASDGARSLKRRELWRSVMAALCGMGASFERRRQDDDR